MKISYLRDLVTKATTLIFLVIMTGSSSSLAANGSVAPPSPFNGFNPLATFNIIAAHTRKAIDVNPGMDIGAGVYQWDLWDGDNQAFQLRYINGYYQFRPVHLFDRCLDAGSGLHALFTLQQCSDTNLRQQFSIEPLSSGYKIRVRSTGLYWSVQASGQNNGTPLVQYVFDNASSQTFSIYPASSRSFSIFSLTQGFIGASPDRRVGFAPWDLEWETFTNDQWHKINSLYAVFKTHWGTFLRYNFNDNLFHDFYNGSNQFDIYMNDDGTLTFAKHYLQYTVQADRNTRRPKMGQNYDSIITSDEKFIIKFHPKWL